MRTYRQHHFLHRKVAQEIPYILLRASVGKTTKAKDSCRSFTTRALPETECRCCAHLDRRKSFRQCCTQAGQVANA